MNTDGLIPYIFLTDDVKSMTLSYNYFKLFLNIVLILGLVNTCGRASVKSQWKHT